MSCSDRSLSFSSMMRLKSFNKYFFSCFCRSPSDRALWLRPNFVRTCLPPLPAFVGDALGRLEFFARCLRSKQGRTLFRSSCVKGSWDRANAVRSSLRAVYSCRICASSSAGKIPKGVLKDWVETRKETDYLPMRSSAAPQLLSFPHARRGCTG